MSHKARSTSGGTVQVPPPAPPRNGRFWTIAVDGRGGSGKSTLARLLGARMSELVVVHGDEWFEPVDHPEVWGVFNEERMQRDLVAPLLDGNLLQLPSAGPVVVDTAVCLERCYSFGVGLDWDLRLWVETPKALCFERGTVRDGGDERALTAWRYWQREEDAYIEATEPRRRADIVLDGTAPFEHQLG